MAKTLIERAPESAVRAALIQNGNNPDPYSHSGISFVKPTPGTAVGVALIPNGNDPGTCSDSGVGR
ncbi:MAG: hypothetical protein ACRDRS_24405 [Pseudonocardiaceae bacterium]